ncbi:MAG: NADH-quinone oxidoreductase subunit A [Nitrospirae bacterium]|nr:NADH-quinone oxidoreductase subunit A [Nitrospirota bacterium]MCL5238050.1 NADH-quinone oxidoreductase subunit A [Nitrospirota bacterium]
MSPITPGNYLPSEYLPIMILMIIAGAFGAGALIVGALFRIRRSYREKLMPYESGNPPIGEPRYRFSVKFYIIAMLFVVFDVEAVFLYPWALVYDKIGLYALIEMMLFITVLVVGYIYAWKKEAFKWD